MAVMTRCTEYECTARDYSLRDGSAVLSESRGRYVGHWGIESAGMRFQWVHSVLRGGGGGSSVGGGPLTDWGATLCLICQEISQKSKQMVV
jgi:hypothetical protein